MTCSGSASNPASAASKGGGDSDAKEGRLLKELEAKTEVVKGALWLAAALAVVAVVLAITSIFSGSKTEGFRVVGHWGGFGGGTGGWRMSPGLAGLLVAAVIALAAVMLVATALQVMGPSSQGPSPSGTDKKQDAK